MFWFRQAFFHMWNTSEYYSSFWKEIWKKQYEEIKDRLTKNIMKSRFSVVLGKLDNIESLLKKHIIFVLLCFAQISQTLHVCGATMKFAYFFARNSGRRFTWVVCEIRCQNMPEKLGDINLFLNWIQVKTFENLRKKARVMCKRDS